MIKRNLIVSSGSFQEVDEEEAFIIKVNIPNNNYVLSKANIRYEPSDEYRFAKIDWGDGTFQYPRFDHLYPVKTYENSGEYIIRIYPVKGGYFSLYSGSFHTFTEITEIIQWGNFAIGGDTRDSLNSTFASLGAISYNYIDSDFSRVKILDYLDYIFGLNISTDLFKKVMNHICGLTLYNVKSIQGLYSRYTTSHSISSLEENPFKYNKLNVDNLFLLADCSSDVRPIVAYRKMLSNDLVESMKYVFRNADISGLTPFSSLTLCPKENPNFPFLYYNSSNRVPAQGYFENTILPNGISDYDNFLHNANNSRSGHWIDFSGQYGQTYSNVSDRNDLINANWLIDGDVEQ